MQLPARIKSVKALLLERSPRGQMLRFGLFLVLYWVARYPQFFLNSNFFHESLITTIHEQLAFFITHVCCFVLQIFYPDIHSTADHIIFINGKSLLQLLPGCSGLDPMIRLTFILLFYPLLWRKKAWLWPISLAILLFAATLHFLLLIPITYHVPEWYTFAHNWLTRIIFYGFYFLCWLMWEKARNKEPKPIGAN